MDDNIKGVLLLGDENSIIQDIKSDVNIITFKDSLLVKVYKYLASKKINSSMKSELFIENPDIINWVIIFKEYDKNIEDVLNFCEKNKYNLLILKNNINLNIRPYSFSIIHANYKSSVRIVETIFKNKTP